MKTNLIGAALAALWCASATAQTIYESKDQAGSVKIESAPVSLFVHRAAVGGRRGR